MRLENVLRVWAIFWVLTFGETAYVVILPAVKDDEAKKIYPDGCETVKPYLRKVPDPTK